MMNGYDQLLKEVIDADICVSCGNCAAVCPLQYISIVDNKPVQDTQKRSEIESRSGLACNDCNICVMSCPRIEPSYFWQKKELERAKYDGKPKAARTTYQPIKDVCQDGGVVTTIFKYLLDNNLVDGVVVSQYNENCAPVPVVAATEEDLLSAAGSRYTVSSIYSPLTDLKKLKDKGYERLAIVGTPCQIYALRKTQAIYNRRNMLIPHNIITFAVGLFCKGQFDDQILQSIDIDKAGVAGFDVKKEGMIISFKDGKKKIITHEELDKYTRAGCSVCPDFTSVYADISVGSEGSPKGWSTVITRTEKGRQLYQKLIDKELIESAEVDEKGHDSIERTLRQKEERSRVNIEKRLGLT
ncbi:MAG: Coenzyme F420-dependent sulfite reductase [Candidatus Argoarchaeum ethanivorans]|uniref:Coenzyme F420-dependent sulfite reductase n=2 Tax=Candidatus Argoarchaeum ethanivorans TaxID=2608793 RepID=A0A811TD50_9EURY|nr:MAG: Coenzyme F420-dependent sulfite reductase [Candidatus Argoarchaeum ethanivorans]